MAVTPEKWASKAELIRRGNALFQPLALDRLEACAILDFAGNETKTLPFLLKQI